MSEQEYTLKEVLLKYPNSTARAFELNQDESCMYFMMNPPEWVNSPLPNGIKCHFPALKVVKGQGLVLHTKIWIKNSDLVQEHDMATFLKLLEAELELIKKMADTPIRKERLEIFKELGF